MNAQVTNQPPAQLRRSVGGIFDHRATWRYRTSASSRECIAAFTDAFARGGGVFAKAHWNIDRTSTGAVASYAGRRGVLAVAGMFSQTTLAEEQGAVGSEVRFEIEEQGPGYVVCAMWLASRSTRLGFTNDARFIRPHMRGVEVELRRVDPDVQVVKG